MNAPDNRVVHNHTDEMRSVEGVSGLASAILLAFTSLVFAVIANDVATIRCPSIYSA